MSLASLADTALNVGDPSPLVDFDAHVGAEVVQPAVQRNVTPPAPTTIGDPPFAATAFSDVPDGHTPTDTVCAVQ